MNRRSLQPVIAVLLGLALFMTLGFSYLRSEAVHTQGSHSSSSSLAAHAAAARVPQPATVPLSAAAMAEKLHLTQAINHETPIALVKAPSQSTDTYEVTAYYLNVRASSNSRSKIKGVMRKGDRIEIEQAVSNSWLKLKNNKGYIHGAYATKVTKNSNNEVMISALRKSEPDLPTSHVKSASGLNEEHISTLFKGTALEDQGLEKVILDIEEEYGINALFTIAVLKLESGNGKSKLAQNKNNLFGLNAIDGDASRKAFSFKTKGDSVRKFGQLISKNYVGKGYTTIEKVATKYCPANEKWPALVTTIMRSDYKKL